MSHHIYIISYTFVTFDDLSKLKGKLISSYKFLKFVIQMSLGQNGWVFDLDIPCETAVFLSVYRRRFLKGH